MSKIKTKEISFRKISNKWYCDIKNWPKTLFAQTLMVGNASKLIDEMAEGKDYVTFKVISSKKELPNYKTVDSDYIELVKTESSITGGAIYAIEPAFMDTTLWLCPVTLFVLHEYPNYIYFKNK